ncbi:MAG: ribosome silencing factor [Cyanobacteria bacterium P01_E01_bin.42]
MTQPNPNINPSPLFVVSTSSEDPSLALAGTIAEAADDRKAGDILLLSVTEISYLTDYFIIATGFSRAQVRAICNSIENAVEEQHERVPDRVEGKSAGSWIVLDYGEAIAHILLPEEREYYNLEAFWGHAKRIDYQFDRAVGE